VTLGIQEAKRKRHIILFVTCLALPYVSTLPHKGHNFRKKKKKVTEYKSVFWFSLQILSETFVILRRMQRVVIINVDRSSCKVHVTFFFVFQRNLDFLHRFSRKKIMKYQISRKFFRWGPSRSMRTYRRTCRS